MAEISKPYCIANGLGVALRGVSRRVLLPVTTEPLVPRRPRGVPRDGPMSAQDPTNFRPLEERDHKLLERLLEHHPFEGRDQLREQLDSTTARLIVEHNDNYG